MTGPTLDRRRILVVAKAFPPVTGGIETYSAAVAAEYSRRGADVTVITQVPGRSGQESSTYAGSNFRLVNVGPGPQWVAFAKLLWAIFSFLRGGTPDMIHATTWRPALAVLLLRPAVPVVVTVHGRELINNSAPMRAAMRFVLARASAGVAVSDSTLALLDTVVAPKDRRGPWAVAWNGTTVPQKITDSARPPAVDWTCVRLFTLCRLVPRKNVGRIVEALGVLQTEGFHNFRYRIAGDGPLRATLESQVSARGLTDRVVLLGRIDDDEVLNEYQDCDVFLHPHSHTGVGNDFEGFGIVVADAMACARVVVVGAEGGPADYIQYGANGLTVDGDDLEDICRVLRRLLLGEVDTESMGRAAHEFATQSFTWQRHVDCILGVAHLEVARPAA